MPGPRPSGGSWSRSPTRGRIWRDNRTRQGQRGTAAEAEVRRLASKINVVRERSIETRPQRGGRGRGPRPRGYAIAWKRQSHESTGSLPSFRDYGGLRKISIGGWRILGYGGTRGYNQSHQISTAEVNKGRRYEAI